MSLCRGGASILAGASSTATDRDGNCGGGLTFGLAGGGGVVSICFCCNFGVDFVVFNIRLPAVALWYFL